MAYRGSRKGNYSSQRHTSTRSLSKSSLMNPRMYEDLASGFSPTKLDYQAKPFDLRKIQEIESKKWEEIRQIEERERHEGWNPDKAFAERIKIVEKYEPLLKKPDLKNLVFSTSIGHYGGRFIDIPEENFEAFKAFFPPNEFPREVRTVDVRTQWTIEGEQAFRRRFPNSNTIKQVFFADRSKGLKRLEYMDLPFDDSFTD